MSTVGGVPTWVLSMGGLGSVGGVPSLVHGLKFALGIGQKFLAFFFVFWRGSNFFYVFARRSKFVLEFFITLRKVGVFAVVQNLQYLT